MYKGNFNSNNRSGKPSFHRGQKTSNPSSRGRSFPVHRRAGRFNNSGQSISISRFICKADPVIDEKPYEPKNAFVDFSFDDRIKANVATKGYVLPTPIQDQSIPEILKGLDVVGIANTGTGKTAAFLLPIIDKVLKNIQEKVLIIVPTRELAVQINQEFIDFRGQLKLFSVCCVGGASIGQQISSLRRNHNFVIGTPGRLKDLIERRVIDPSRFGTIVLDEADRMLDMGFINDMRFIMTRMAPMRQTLFFSATVNREIDELIKEFLKDPITISVKTGETAKNVDQDIVRIERGAEKIKVLHDLLISPEFSKVLIFGRTKHGVEKLSQELDKRGLRSTSIHGNKNQNKRQQALNAFKSDNTKILVATDVAARGLDIPDVSHVINYDLPATYEDYVHRIGRTGRGGKTGKALTFID